MPSAVTVLAHRLFVRQVVILLHQAVEQRLLRDSLGRKTKGGAFEIDSHSTPNTVLSGLLTVLDDATRAVN